jgi:hypothetical protein
LDSNRSKDKERKGSPKEKKSKKEKESKKKEKSSKESKEAHKFVLVSGLDDIKEVTEKQKASTEKLMKESKKKKRNEIDGVDSNLQVPKKELLEFVVEATALKTDDLSNEDSESLSDTEIGI